MQIGSVGSVSTLTPAERPQVVKTSAASSEDGGGGNQATVVQDSAPAPREEAPAPVSASAESRGGVDILV